MWFKCKNTTSWVTDAMIKMRALRKLSLQWVLVVMAFFYVKIRHPEEGIRMKCMAVTDCTPTFVLKFMSSLQHCSLNNGIVKGHR